MICVLTASSPIWASPRSSSTAASAAFPYHDDAPLDMRMDASRAPHRRGHRQRRLEDELTRIFRDYGEENWARQIARVVVDRRPIETTLQLVAAIDAAIPKKVRAKDGSHPARRVFQALRIAVNDELEPLRASLEMLAGLLKPGGRLCVIAFHSLEDRIVKNAFRTLADPAPVKEPPRMRLRQKAGGAPHHPQAHHRRGG